MNAFDAGVLGATFAAQDKSAIVLEAIDAHIRRVNEYLGMPNQPTEQ